MVLVSSALNFFGYFSSYISGIIISKKTFFIALNISIYLQFSVTLYFYQFIFLIYAVKMRFEKLNQCLRSIFREELNNKEKVDVISLTMKIHDDLNGIVEIINQCYSFPAMFYLASLYTVILMFLFNLVTFKSYFDFDDMFLVFITDFILNIYQLTYPLLIMGLGSAATKEGQRTSFIIHKILNESCGKEIDQKVSYIFFGLSLFNLTSNISVDAIFSATCESLSSTDL